MFSKIGVSWLRWSHVLKVWSDVLQKWKLKKTSSKHLGFIFDSTFSFNKQVSTIAKTSFFFFFWAFAQVKLLFLFPDYEKVVQVLTLVWLVVSVLSCATCLMCYSSIGQLCAPLWLPVCFRIQFQILLFVLRSLALSYLSGLLIWHSPRSWRGGQVSRCSWGRYKKNRGDQVFTLAAASL